MEFKCRKLTAPLLISALSAVSLSGCVVDHEMQVKASAGMVQAKRDAHEQKMREEWSGKEYTELVEEYGIPPLTMHVTRKGGPPSTGFIYDSDETSGCIDAFVVLQGEGTVIDYFCR